MNLTQKSIRRTDNTSVLHRIYERLDWLIKYYGSELAQKQQNIQQLQNEIELLKKTLAERDETILELENKLNQCSSEEEGNRQLINKLLADISKYENDIEWFKRTYEHRSVLGLFKQKFFK
ncbi:hypothetical protein [Chryseosolibacter indicus]|uniref:Uncharacterized protein n=1 Tax=Chryseosolibacter indicus TaxID=2782351 RepID=A0ABS5VQ63_9BACT|nr:hypothetical protein [Chryseosolibacter indicus]MBT1703590.1 hypothetical protein [Chryseosolibacter indicus]